MALLFLCLVKLTSPRLEKKLIGCIKTICFSLVFEERKIQEAAVTFNAKLKQALEKERESKKFYEDSSTKFEVKLENFSKRQYNFSIKGIGHDVDVEHHCVCLQIISCLHDSVKGSPYR